MGKAKKMQFTHMRTYCFANRPPQQTDATTNPQHNIFMYVNIVCMVIYMYVKLIAFCYRKVEMVSRKCIGMSDGTKMMLPSVVPGLGAVN